MPDTPTPGTLPIDRCRFHAGERVLVWGKPAVVVGMYLTHPNIIRFILDGTTAESTIATHFTDGLNPQVQAAPEPGPTGEPT